MTTETLHWAGLSAALLLPWLLGAAWLFRLRNAAISGDRIALLGYAYLLGIAVTTLLMRFADSMGRGLNFTELAIAIGALASAGLFLTLRRRPSQADAPPTTDWNTGKALLFGLFLLLILAHLAFDAHEIALRPLFPWDAWASWGYKAKIWFEHAAITPIVSPETWLNAPEQHLYTEEAHHYPPMVSLIQTWTALGMGRWTENLINLPWLLCGIALGVGFYGQSRAMGSTPLTAVIFTYLMLSLPLLDTHIALAGYADLWMTAAFTLAAMALLRWADSRESSQLLLAVLLATVCVMTKNEGAVWLLALLLGWLAAAAPRLLAILTLVVVGLSGVALTGDGIQTAIPGIGHFQFNAQHIALEPFGGLDLSVKPVLTPLMNNLFTLSNWHLLWYLVPVVLLLALVRRIRLEKLLPATVLMLASGGIFLGIFLFSDASRWAQDYTAVNRVLLHIAPAWLFVTQLLVNRMAATPRRQSTS